MCPKLAGKIYIENSCQFWTHFYIIRNFLKKDAFVKILF